MQKKIQMEASNWQTNYSDDKFAIVNACFLSTAPNTHDIEISEDVLRRDAQSILGSFLVAEIAGNDFWTHTPSEKILGYAPQEQTIEFKTNDAGYLEAYADFVVSKTYAADALEIFEKNNQRSTSVEMLVASDDDEPQVAQSIDIFGLTVLGLDTKPSCSDAFAKVVRFSVEDATRQYGLWAEQPRELTAELASDSENYKQKEEIPMDTEMIKEAEEETPVEASVDTEEVDACGGKTVAAADDEVEETPVDNADDDESEDEPEEPETDEEEVDAADIPAEEDNVDERVAELEMQLEDRDNQIAAMTAELEELRAFKAAADDKQRAEDVDEVMAEVDGTLDEETMAELRKEGCAAETEFSAWSNKVKALAFSAGGSKKKPKKNLWGTAISFATNTKIEKPHGLWD